MIHERRLSSRAIRGALRPSIYRESPKFAANFSGKVICFEWIVWAVIQLKGFENVKNRLVRGGAISDQGLKECMQGGRASKRAVERYLQSNFVTLNSDCGGMLTPLGLHP